VAANYTLKISKTIRAYGGALILATQQITDIYGIENGKYGEGVLNNCKIKIVLKVEEKDADNIQGILHLTDSEARKLTRYRQGEGLISINGNNVEIKFTGSATEHELITTDREDLKVILEKSRLKKNPGYSKTREYVEVIDSEEIVRVEKKKHRSIPAGYSCVFVLVCWLHGFPLIEDMSLCKTIQTHCSLLRTARQTNLKENLPKKSELALAGCFRLLLALHGRLLIMLTLPNFSDDAVFCARTLETLESGIQGLVLTNAYFCHEFFPPFVQRQRLIYKDASCSGTLLISKSNICIL
jgi:hypothetical protein